MLIKAVGGLEAVALPDLLEGSVAVKRWRDALAPSTFTTYRSWLRGYLLHLGKTADGAVEWAKGCEDKYLIVDTIQAYVRSLQKTRRYKTQVSMMSTLRSFYLHNRVHLPDDPSFIIRAEIPPVE